MVKKYIDVKIQYLSDKTIPEIQPEDIIFFVHFFDMNYDRPSENMGHFLTIAYLDGDEICSVIFPYSSNSSSVTLSK